jgi:hypothetical protein
VIVYLPAVLLAAGLALAYAAPGRVRTAATLAVVAAATWSLALMVGPAAVWWGGGPLLATLLLGRPPQRLASSFEVLTRRGVTLAVTLVTALFAASRLPIGEQPLLLSAVPWWLAALGTAWFVSPIDHRERLQGLTLMIGAAGALVLAAVPAGSLTVAAAGAMCLMPLAGERMRVPGRLRPGIGLLFVGLGLIAAGLAASGFPVPRGFVVDLSFNLAGPVLTGVGILLMAGALVTPIGFEWVGLLALIALTASAPVLRWAALAALIAVATGVERRGERVAWIGFGLLALTPILQALASPTWSARAQVVALGAGLVLILVAATAGMLRTLVLPAATLIVVLALEGVSTANLTRFQWVAAVGVGVLIMPSLLVRFRLIAAAERPALREHLLLGLLLLAIGARDPLGLGLAAATLLLVDLSVVRPADAFARVRGWTAKLTALARSNWPPALSFAGSTLAVIAALQPSLPLGLLATGLLAGLQVSPLLDLAVPAPAENRPHSALIWIAPALSLACGLAPALVLRMLRL